MTRGEAAAWRQLSLERWYRGENGREEGEERREERLTRVGR